MNHLIAGAIPIVWHNIQDRYYDDKMVGPETFLGMVHSGMPYAGGLSLALFTLLTSQGYMNNTLQNAVIVGVGTYLPFFITSTKEFI